MFIYLAEISFNKNCCHLICGFGSVKSSLTCRPISIHLSVSLIKYTVEHFSWCAHVIVTFQIFLKTQEWAKPLSGWPQSILQFDSGASTGAV